MSKPIVGITLSGPVRNTAAAIKNRQDYVDAIELAGGEVRFLPPKPEGIGSEFEGLDALLLTGGPDVHPDLYNSRKPGEEDMTAEELKKEYRLEWNVARDEYELPLARKAFEMKLPILGICRGFQVLNVILGGSLILDIRTRLKHWAIRKDETDEGTPGESRKHLATIESKSVLAKIVGDCPMLVNSRHHQGIMEKEKAKTLTATAYAPDGIIEAVEATDHHWALAVQWHPEKKSDSYVYEACKPLFGEFIKAAKTYQKSS